MSETAPFGFLRVAAASPPVTVGDPARNLEGILHFVERAGEQGVQVLVFPELSLTGYTCADLFFSRTLQREAVACLERLLTQTRNQPMLIAVGLPLESNGRLFNVAALCQAGQLLGVVPKTFLPGYDEYYEERWFSSAREALVRELRVGEHMVSFGNDLIFELPTEPDVSVAVEICEDLWAPLPPTTLHAVAGATLLLNLSASNETISKAAFRRELVKQHSARTVSAYAYANAGVHESTTDTVFAGQLLIAENGELLAENPRFERDGELLVSDVDLERLRVRRSRLTSFADAVHPQKPNPRRIGLQPIPAEPERRLLRQISPHPFAPRDPASLDERCREVFEIQTAALAKRLEHTGISRAVIGLSGGLDSTLALLVCVRTFDRLKRDRLGVLAVTLPGFGTTDRTLASARSLAEAARVELREIDIRPACERHIADIGLDPDDRESNTFQNLQARERTQVLMDLANKEAGLVVGTGDLSELALGFCTFAGDHIAMYNVNAGVPKTLVRQLVEWVAEHHGSDREREVLRDVIDTPVSPELVPADADGRIAQKTEEIIGPYELHDFFLWAMLRLGAGPKKILYLASQAFPDTPRDELRRWLRLFVERFFQQQFKRSVMPDGPKVGTVSLSPRGDWRMPSDASPAAWLRELEGPED